MSRFNPITENAFRSAGWYPGRVVDTWRYEADYHHAHKVFPEFARKFLSEFGHLILQPDPKPPADMPTYGACDVYFNTILAGTSIDDEILDSLSEVAGQELGPIGEFNRYDENWYHFSYCVLLLGSNGHFFKSVVDMDNLMLVGQDMDELHEYQRAERSDIVLFELSP